ncbi:MAG: 4-hydroxy-3-methylbut-2-enyl diphosphate reductase [Desulfovibrionaceae bacterium]|nr:4-hydroxy-3-methylbut-2-enyl diphosphate reductase [Desulfovibrionaceae bacterium]
MRVIRASTAGFCMGVSLAVGKLERALAGQNGPGLYTLGPIIHNPLLVREYEKKGAVCLEDPRLAARGSTVIIRAHGLPRLQEEELFHLGLRVVDATCPKVKDAQTAIRRAGERGLGTLLLLGEKDHPEVRGLLSYAVGRPLVFSSLEELRGLPLDSGGEYFLAAQTTQDQNSFEQVLEWLNSFLDKPVAVLRTICDATGRRQEELIRLAGQVNSMVIVGGLNSGNTRRLADISRGLGLFTAQCEEAALLPLDELVSRQPVGLSAGASTPDAQIRDVEKILRDFR